MKNNIYICKHCGCRITFGVNTVAQDYRYGEDRHTICGFTNGPERRLICPCNLSNIDFLYYENKKPSITIVKLRGFIEGSKDTAELLYA